MTNLHTSIILQISKNQDHSNAAIKFLNNLDHTKNIKANNPNLIIFSSEDSKVNIALVRNMIAESSLSIYSGKTRVMILTHADTASIPAQNSLLKLVEEPPENTQIILTANNPNLFLPTILSRCLLIKQSNQPSPSGRGHLVSAKQNQIGEANESEVLPTSYSTAINLAEKHKDRNKAIELVENLILNLQKQNSNSPEFKTTKNLKILSETLQHLHANVNVRLALENGMFGMI